MSGGTREVAVIGGGPAGAVCAAELAAAGCAVTVFEGRPRWEKPCAGGLTPPLLDEFPWLHQLDDHCVASRRVRLEMPGGALDVPLSRPVRIVERVRLHALLRSRAETAGAIWRDEFARTIEDRGSMVSVNEKGFDCVVGADGALSLVRRIFDRAPRRDELALSVGLYVPGCAGETIVVRMLPQLGGYAWIFPREDDCTVGLVALNGAAGADELHAEVARLAADRLSSADVARATRFAHVLPAVRGGLLDAQRMCGPRFALAGDAAGLCDQLTGEGIRWAMISGRLAARAIAGGDPTSYAALLRRDVLPELNAAGRCASFMMREGLLRLVARVAPRSAALRAVLDDYLNGSLHYVRLKGTLIDSLARFALEYLASIFSLGRNEFVDSSKRA